MKNKLSGNKKIVISQVVFLGVLLAMVYFLYPKVNVDVDGNFVDFKSINANVIMISENSDFSNPRYLEFSERNNFSFNLEPGTYYWKPSNSLIGGFGNQFIIESEVGLEVNRSNGTELVNVGNVKINVTKQGGIMVGHIILEPEDVEKIEDKGEYVGRQIE